MAKNARGPNEAWTAAVQLVAAATKGWTAAVQLVAAAATAIAALPTAPPW